MTPARALRAVRRRVLARAPGFVRCTVCGHAARRFEPHGIKARPNARCQQCHLLERHRLLWVLLEELTATPPQRLLHVAPEPGLRPHLVKRSRHYVTIDLMRSDVTARADLTRLPFADGAFDALICSHVLEHIPDDAAAMAELRRVLRPGGWGVIDSPLRMSVPTDEDVDASPDERTRRFGQPDHVRYYGSDFPERLRAAGFAVTERTATDVLGKGLRRAAVTADRRTHVVR